MRDRNARGNGQVTVETALLILAVTASLVLFFGLIKSTVAYRLKSGSDAFGHGLQYDACWPSDTRPGCR